MTLNIVNNDNEIVKYIAKQGGITTENLPVGLVPIQEAKPEILYRVVVKPEMKSMGKCFKLAEDDTHDIEIVIPEGLTVKSIKDDYVYKYIENNVEEWQLDSRIAELDYKPELQRTCKFFTAGLEQKENFKTEDSEFYEFDRPHKTQNCSNEQLKAILEVPNPHCNVQFQPMCQFYEPEIWLDIIKWDSKDHSIILSTTRVGFGTRVYSLSLLDSDVNVTVTEEDFLQVFENMCNEHMIEGELLESSLKEEKIKNGYFEYVLTS